MAAASSSSSSVAWVSTADRPLVYLDIDVDGHAAAFTLAQEFVQATDKRYGWSSKFLADLGGSERSRIREAYEADFEWSTKGKIELDPAPHTRVIIALYADTAPNCAQNFACLCTGEKGKAKGSSAPLHYSGVPFHRMVKGSLIQGGDVAMHNGSGGESIWSGREGCSSWKCCSIDSVCSRSSWLSLLVSSVGAGASRMKRER
jgi:hypothetical protein